MMLENSTARQNASPTSAAPGAIGGARTSAPAAPVIHAMPAKFLPKTRTSARSGSLTRWMLILALAVFVVGGGVFVFAYVLQRQPVAETNANTNRAANSNQASNTNAANTNVGGAAGNGNENRNAVPSTQVQGTYVDAVTDETLSTATLTIPARALPATVQNVTITALDATIGAYATSKKYAALGGVFLLLPARTALTESATLSISYTPSMLGALNFIANEQDLTAAYWDGNEWTPLTSRVDGREKTVTASVSEFYGNGIALVVPVPSSTNTNTASNTNGSTSATIVSSIDSDADGLTNQEEILYGTNAGSPDTDLDSYRDGQEVLALYNPSGTNKLADAALVKTYENTTYGYSLFYPPSWTLGTLSSDKTAVFTSVTGEFVQLSVQENPSGQSAREWYLALNPSVAQTSLKDMSVGTLSGIIGPDGLNVYLAHGTNIYQLTYNIGIRTEANYLTTFTMMYTSFSLRTTAKTANGNTNAAGTNANTNAAKNANTTASKNKNTNKAGANANTKNTNTTKTGE